MATYYTKIKGKNYDKKLLNTAKSLVRGKGDGRISIQDAKKLLRMVKDSASYSDIEKNTMKYIRDNYSFTPESNKWFRTEIAKWAASGVTVKKPARPKKAAAAKKKIPSKKPKAPVRAAVKPKKKTAFKKTPAPARFIEQKIEEREPVFREQSLPARTAPSGKKSFAIRIILFFLILVIIAILIALLSPTCRERIKNRIAPAIPAIEKEAPVMPDTKPAPVTEVKPTPEPEPVKTAEPKQEEGNIYTVQVKDDLIKISEKELGDYNKWKDLYEANRDVIKYPWIIYPGQKLKLPAVQDVKK